MKVLIIGNGGREHALAWKTAQSPLCDQLFLTRPNAAMSRLGEAVDIAPSDTNALHDFAKRVGIDLTIVGPEAPLVAGLVDQFRASGLRAWGPTKACARLEGSKAFAKDLMHRIGVPTARYGVFQQPDEARKWLRTLDGHVAVKADGLAAGKGVILCRDVDQADDAIETILVNGVFGQAGASVVVEELLQGEEASFIALCDGKNVLPLASSQDHKRIGHGDTGLNTGGMGAYSPAAVVTPEITQEVIERVMIPVVNDFAAQGTPFTGFLYAGLMITESGPQVLEFNVRLGDPETQPLMMRLKSDLLELLNLGLDGRLDEAAILWDEKAALCVVMASEGYPQSARKGDLITGLPEPDDGCMVFHAGTTADHDGRVFTAGGRVLGITALGDDLSMAAVNAYRVVDGIAWPGAQFRRDIGWRAFEG
jgi:phosphoribosylamine--glycine ligase